MNRTKQRFMAAAFFALILHGALLSWQLSGNSIVMPKHLSIERVTVSLGMSEAGRDAPPPSARELLRSFREPQPAPASGPATGTATQPVVRKSVEAVREQARKKTGLSRSEERAVQPDSPLTERVVQARPVREPVAASFGAGIKDGSSGATSAAKVVRQAVPRYRRNRPPQYPLQARLRGVEGLVLLEVLVDISGRVADIKLLASSAHSALDRAAVRAVRRWSFIPGTIASKKTKMWVRVPVRFRLN